MRIDIKNWIKELQLIDKAQEEAIKDGDNFKLAACFLKIANDCRINAEYLEKNGQMIIKANLNNLL